MNPLILFAPGAGASSASDWMQTWKHRLATLGDVVTFDYPYMVAGKKRPDPHDRLVAAHRDALERVREDPSRPAVLAGKSMGSRIGCHVSLELKVTALVCFGYPLVGVNGRVRDEVLLALRMPILFIQGTRDPLCPLERLATTRAAMHAPNDLHVVPEGDHSLRVTRRFLKAHATDQETIDLRILDAIQTFLSGLPRL